MTMVNTVFNPERLFVSVVDRFENSLDLLWNRAHTNEVPQNMQEFNEYRDPQEILAEDALQKEVSKQKANREVDSEPKSA